jgi:hypothetical protein
LNGKLSSSRKNDPGSFYKKSLMIKSFSAQTEKDFFERYMLNFTIRFRFFKQPLSFP